MHTAITEIGIGLIIAIIGGLGISSLTDNNISILYIFIISLGSVIAGRGIEKLR